MKIDIAYTELSLLRELVGKHKLKLWRTLYLPNLPKEKQRRVAVMKMKTDLYKLGDLYEKIMNTPAPQQPFDEKDWCNSLLQKFQKMEDKIQRALGRKK